jgi:hypothetical protein
MKRLWAVFFVTLSGLVAVGAEPDTAWKSDAAMHAHFKDSFLGADGNGFSRMIAPQMVINDFMWLTLDTETYKLGTLELIGIAKHDSPVAFVASRHRRPADQARQTRELTTFETEALRKLSAGAELSSETQGNRRSVVGALRADQNCILCHSGYKAGDVLGALSYRLDAAKPPVASTLE